MITTVLFDLDGVIRHFDPEVATRAEQRHGLAAGVIGRSAFDGSLIGEVVTGRMSRAEWVERIGDAIGSGDAAREWASQQGRIDPALPALAEELAECGLRTAILTNGTDTIPAEAAALGLAEMFAPIFNTADLGHAKPDPRAFELVLDALGCEAESVFFTDDSAGNVAAAAALGFAAHVFDGVEGLRAALRGHGVGVG